MNTSVTILASHKWFAPRPKQVPVTNVLVSKVLHDCNAVLEAIHAPGPGVELTGPDQALINLASITQHIHPQAQLLLRSSR